MAAQRPDPCIIDGSTIGLAATGLAALATRPVMVDEMQRHQRRAVVILRQPPSKFRLILKVAPSLSKLTSKGEDTVVIVGTSATTFVVLMLSAFVTLLWIVIAAKRAPRRSVSHEAP